MSNTAKKLRKMQILLTRIPKGRVSTYKLLAKRLDVHPRVSGMLLSCNTDTKKYPCYRIVCSSGKIGGYSGRGGVRGKVSLLRSDGIEVRNGKIDLKKHIFEF
jgi:methylated-DNA-[protein]-cysteine S-methyltransferase